MSHIDLFEKEGDEIKGYVKAKGMICGITSFEELERVLKLKEK